MSCGTALASVCPSCDTENPPGAKFCIECGTALTASVPDAAATPPGAAPAPPPAADLPEERRQVTVLFADLSGYTAVAERMDPESVKALVDRCLRRLSQEVERYGGTVDKYIGDNVMAIFGAPVAHEDDAERAIRAALDMQGAMAEMNDELGVTHGVSFALRVGVNTGEVVAGAVGDGYTVMGDTVNVAARLQAAGRPGEVTVGERTFRATRHAVEYRQLDALNLKGKAEPVAAWEATGLLAARPERRAAIESPLVGREEELSLIQSLYDRVERERRPHLVTVIGEAGVGKSRLLRELEEQLGAREDGPAFRHGRCLAYGSGIVYWALGEVIRAECGIVDTDPSDVAWDKLATGVGELVNGGTSQQTSALIARLLGIETPVELPAAEAEDPQRMRESFFSAVRSCVEGMARRRPLVLAFEDIHWADEGMLDLIEFLARWVHGPLLILCLARDELMERRAGWGSGRRQATQVVLEPLTLDQTQDLVAALLPTAGNGGGDMAQVVADRAGGNPFFAEEMVRRLREQESGDAAELPETVHGLLAARLDSLDGFERRLVQHAAVVGRTFWTGWLASAAVEDSGDLAGALASLQEKDIFVPGEMGSQLAGERELAFKHVLIRDVAYGTLPKAVRCWRHFEVGRFIEERAGDRTDEFVPLLAEHYGRAADLGEEAGLGYDDLGTIHAKALRFLEAAGDAAAAIYSNEEAFSQYKAARELRCPHDPERLARIGEKLGDVALRMGRVDAALDAWEECLEYQRAQENLERVGDLNRKIGAGLWHKGETKQAIQRYQKGINLLKDGPPSLELVHLYEEAASLYMHTGDNMLAIYASEKALRLAERLGETRAASRAHGIFGRVFGRIGDTQKARENLERSVELARESDRSETIRALLTLGYHLEISDADYTGAGEAYEEALDLAREVGDLPAQVELHAALALLAVWRADWEAAWRATEASAEVAEREGLVGKLSFPYMLRGLLLWRQGDWDRAEDTYRRAHELAEQAGWSEVDFSSLYGLAMTLRDRGDHAGSVTALDQALDVCERAGLIAQSIQAMSARAVTLTHSGRFEQAAESAEEAGRLAERLHYPLAQAAATEARGACSLDPEQGARLLEDARSRWLQLGRPLDAARCDLWRGRLLWGHDPEAASEALEAAREAFEELGVPHLAQRARELAAH